ncbi:unnamed protein product [Rhizoctonia solani]|uniref:Uncharacterized protein n=1 Tax=Rhizoctonia solani TaxID=456999 RepID=A0A8H3D8N5_9AGAM|nr:unnamed protein product [Rhizoctonia solani]CAE6519653.1 unnamed protein product [Rhizoctonia solani]
MLDSNNVFGDGHGKNNSDYGSFFVAEYGGKRVGVRGNRDYNVAIESIRKLFPALSNVASSQINLSAFIPRLDCEIELHEEIWDQALLEIKIVKVAVVRKDSEVGAMGIAFGILFWIWFVVFLWKRFSKGQD